MNIFLILVVGRTSVFWVQSPKPLMWVQLLLPLPLENDTNFYSSFFIFLVLSPFLFSIYEYYIKRGMIE